MIKYQTEFNDIDNNICTISIRVRGYSGSPLPLFLDSNPCTLTYQVSDEDDHFSELFISKAEFNFINSNAELMEDLYKFKFGDMVVRLTKSNGLTWEGAILVDEFSTSFSYQSNEVSVSAVDFLSCSEFVEVKHSSTGYYYGLNTIDTYVRQIFTNISSKVYFSNSYNYTLRTNLWQSQFEANNFLLAYLDASIFKADSLPINGLEALKILCRGYRIRAVVVGANQIYFSDVLYSTLVQTDIGFKENYPNFLIGNTEDIIRRKLYRESRVRFESRERTGLIPNGELTDWGTSGFIPAGIAINDVLQARPDLFQRKKGDGNEFDKYRFRIYGTGLYNSPISIDGVNMASNTRTVYTNDIATIEVKLEYPFHKDLTTIVPPNDQFGIQNVSVWYLNTADITRSYRLRGGEWSLFNIGSGTQTMMVNQDTQELITLISFSSPLAYGANERVGLTPEQIKTISIDLPQIPEGEGLIYISVFPLVEYYGTGNAPPYWNANQLKLSTTDIHSINMTVKNAYSSDNGISIVTRNQQGEKKEDTININTSMFSRNSNGILKLANGNPIDMYKNRFNYPFSLSAYGAYLKSVINTKNYKLDFEFKLKNVLEPHKNLKINGLVDNTRPYTQVFNSNLLTQTLSYDTKTNECKATVLSLNYDARNVSTSTISDTIDNIKNYILKNGE